MGGLESDTIGGFNSLLEKQQTESGDCRISTILFDNEYEVLHDRIDIKADMPQLLQQLDETVENLISQGVIYWMSGGAIGFDTLAAQ